MKNIVIVLLTLLLSSQLRANESVSQPRVIAHPSVPVAQLNQAQLRSIFLKRQVIWPGGTSVKVFILPATSVAHRQFSQNHLQMFPYQLERAWQKLTFSGIGTPPALVNSAAEMLLLIQSTPGAIGYLPADNEITDAKIIEITP